ncbi:MAG: hypothetical protein AAFZ15_13590 [Bacteroidota bacterium]
MSTQIDTIIENSEALIDSIKEGSCVLIIGSGFYSGDQEERLENKLFHYLQGQEEKLGIRAYEDGWFHFRPINYGRPVAMNAIKNFYRQSVSEPNNLLEKLVLLPIKLFVSMTPDTKITEAFDASHIPSQFSYYSMEKGGDKPPPVYQPIAGESPIVFNQLGFVHSYNSLIFTHKDFYKYLKAVFEGKNMDIKLKDYIVEAKHFIFLGVPFDMWYVPLFMYVLEENPEFDDKTKYAVNHFLDKKVITHSNERHTITFVEKIGIKEFIESLFMYFKKEEMLRSFDYQLLEELLDKDEFGRFFDHILLKNNELKEANDEFFNEEGIQAYLKKYRRKDVLGNIKRNCDIVHEKFNKLSIEYLALEKKMESGQNNDNNKALEEFKKELFNSLNFLKSIFPNFTADQ